jgi:hypothetical protein
VAALRVGAMGIWVAALADLFADSVACGADGLRGHGSGYRIGRSSDSVASIEAQ